MGSTAYHYRTNKPKNPQAILVESDFLSFENLKISKEWAWYSETGSRLNINRDGYEAVINGRIPRAEIYYRDQTFLEEQLKNAQGKGCIFKVYHHRQDKRRAKLILACDKACKDLFDLTKLEEVTLAYLDALDKNRADYDIPSDQELPVNDVKDAVKELSKNHLSDYMQNQLDTKSFKNLFIANLLSGYPVELTISSLIK